MREKNLLPKRLIRFCGADCSNCDSYKRFLVGDEDIVVNPENNYRCCWLPKDYLKGKDCPIRTCCEEKGILFCGECDQFEECIRMKEFYSKPGYDELKRKMLEEAEGRTHGSFAESVIKVEMKIPLTQTPVEIDQKLLEKIRKMADSPNWEVREDAATRIKKINDKFFLEYLPIWEKWVKDPNPNIRRAVEVGLLRIKKEFVPHAIDLLEVLIYDDNLYVRKNCGPFALSHVGYKDPKATFRRLRKWMKLDDKNVRWNVAMCLGVWFGQTYPNESLKLLKVLAEDKRKFIWRAVASSLVKLIRKHPELKQEVFTWRDCEECLNVVKKYVK